MRSNKAKYNLKHMYEQGLKCQFYMCEACNIQYGSIVPYTGIHMKYNGLWYVRLTPKKVKHPILNKLVNDIVACPQCLTKDHVKKIWRYNHE